MNTSKDMKNPAFAFSEKVYKALEKIYDAHLGKNYAGDFLKVNITGHTETYMYSKQQWLIVELAKSIG